MSVTHKTSATCPNCDGQVEDDPKHGEIVCTDCGTIVAEDTIDHGPEWTAYTAREREDHSRVGSPMTVTLHDRGLSTTISQKNRDAYGNSLSARKRDQMQRLRRWDERYRTRNAKERNFKQAFGEIHRMASALGLPHSVRETACVIYRRAHEENLLLGRSIEGVATAALYAAARQEGIPRTLDEVTIVARVDRQRVARAYRVISEALTLAIKPPDPTSYLLRFASELDCSESVHRQARALLNTVTGTTYMSGKHPAGLAAAALYASACLDGEKISQHEISEVADITSMTIRTHYRDLIARYEADDGR